MRAAAEEGDAFVVPAFDGVVGVFAGRYARAGVHNGRPKYRNEHGSIIFFDRHWKMNMRDDTTMFCFAVREATGEEPPCGRWQAPTQNAEVVAPIVAKA